MADSTFWWAAAGIAVAVELASGTLYLWMLAMGLAVAALAAHAGATLPEQFVVAAIVGGGAAVALHLLRRQQPDRAAARPNAHVDPDTGEIVHIEAWEPDGTATVRFRGSDWTVVPAVGTGHHLGSHRVQAVVGNKLIIEKA
jgi:membrane protein implicated in regulation of membrane protease activity